MPPTRTLDFVLDQPSFTGKPIPPALLALSSNVSVDFAEALLHVALRTRPPTRHGFELADVWACLRYAPAIGAGSDLRLCTSWADVDPHQKTVLSDDFGMGFTTCILTKALDVRRWIPTDYFVKVLHPRKLKLGKSAKRGPRKSPDFVAEDLSGRLSGVECKGSQNTRRDLRAAMSNGVKQKQNLKSGTSRLKHVLVAGLFIPAAASKEDALLEIRDPSWDEFDQLLAASEPRDLLVAAAQIDAAATLALHGAHLAANELASIRCTDLTTLSEAARRQLLGLAAGSEVRTVARHTFPAVAGLLPGNCTGVELVATAPASDLVALALSRDLRAHFERRDHGATGWESRAADVSTTVRTPDGCAYTLNWLGPGPLDELAHSHDGAK